MRVAGFALAAALVAGCAAIPDRPTQGESSKTPQPTGENMKPVSAELPLIRTLADARAHEGKKARIEGRYEVAPIAGSKRLQPVVIVLADGERLLHAYRPRPEEFCFLEKQVVIFGTARLSSGQDPNVQQVMAPHIGIESIELAEGETPWDPVPSELPAPPLVRDAAGFKQHHDRWVRLEGLLEALEEKADESFWGLGRLTLPDGTRVVRNDAPFSRWKEHVGKQVTVVSRAWLSEVDGQTRYSLVDMAEICPGQDESCGLVQPRKPAP